MIKNITKYPDVKYFYTDTKTAFNKIIWKKSKNIENKIKLKIDFFNETNDVPRIRVKTIMKTFGPQPFLAIEKDDILSMIILILI